MNREAFKSQSNNEMNPNKNICTTAVAAALGVDSNVRYLHTTIDVVRAARTKYTVRSRFSKLKKNSSIGAARDTMAKISDNNTIGFLATVDGHVLLLDANGDTVVDTAPRKRDRRKVRCLYIIKK